MNPTGDYTVHFADPDMHVSYHLVNVQTYLHSYAATLNGKISCKLSSPVLQPWHMLLHPPRVKDLRRAQSVSRPRLPQE